MNENSELKQHFFAPENVGDAIETDLSVSLSIGSKAMGEAVRVIMSCNRSENILDFKYKVFGNPYLIASMSYWSVKLKTLNLGSALDLNHSELVEVFQIPRTKLYSALMAEDVVQQIIALWRETYDK